MEGFYPFPWEEAKPIYLFATGLFKLGVGEQRVPLFLKKDAMVDVPSPDVAVITQQSNRDHYRIGVGIDALAAISAWWPNKP